MEKIVGELEGIRYELGKIKLYVLQNQVDSFTYNLRVNELELIYRALGKFSGNKTKVAKLLGISLKTLYNKINRGREK